MSRIQLLDCSKLAINLKNDKSITICRHDTIINFFDIAMFLLSSLVTGPGLKGCTEKKLAKRAKKPVTSEFFSYLHCDFQLPAMV